MRSGASFTIAVALTSLMTVSPALAAGDERPAGRFDDRVRQREGGRIGVAATPIATLGAADGLRVGWEEFATRHGGRWKILLDERTALPTLVSGRSTGL